RPADLLDSHPVTAAVHDAVRAAADRLSLPPAGAWPTNHSDQSNTHRPLAGAHLLSHATGRRKSVPALRRAITSRTDHGFSSHRARLGAGKRIHAALRARERCGSIRRAVERAAAGQAE